MGTWGFGHFDNDQAMDWINDWLEEWVESIEEGLDESKDDPDWLEEEGEGEWMPKVALLAVTLKHTPAVPPDANRLRRWKKRYLCLFDDAMQELDWEEDFVVNRRKAISQTFDDLIQWSESYSQ